MPMDEICASKAIIGLPKICDIHKSTFIAQLLVPVMVDSSFNAKTFLEDLFVLIKMLG